MTSKFNLFTLLLSIFIHVNCNFLFKPPKIGIPTKAILGAGGVAAAFVGKNILDGPEFKENVDLTGKTIIITGSNTGLGKEAALKLASLGKPEVFLLCRNQKKAEAAIQEIISKSGNSNIKFVECDLADLASVQSAADKLKSLVTKIDVLQLNSGVMAIPQREVTKDGFEKQLGVNHLGHFKLTKELYPLLKNTKGARVVTVSSIAHEFGSIDKTDLLLEKAGSYAPWGAYGNSKLANILFSRELNRRLIQSGNPSQITSVSLHPGVCRTELYRFIVDQESIPRFLYPVLGVVGAPLFYFTKDVYMGAQTQIFLSATSNLSPKNGGEYYDNSKIANTNSQAKDPELARWLWEESEKLVGGKFDV